MIYAPRQDKLTDEDEIALRLIKSNYDDELISARMDYEERKLRAAKQYQDEIRKFEARRAWLKQKTVAE